MLDSSTISSPVPLPTRSGTSYSMTRARWMTGSPRSSKASGQGVDVGQILASAGGGQQPLPAPPPPPPGPRPGRGVLGGGGGWGPPASPPPPGGGGGAGPRHNSAAPVAVA